MYDPAKAETVSGEVVSVEQVTPVRRMGMGIAVTLKTAEGNLSVHLGPQWFIERQDIKIVPGDTVEIKGVKAVRGDQNIFIAGEVKKGNEVLKLRDEGGIPVWAGWRRGQNL
jgi:DNA/RNA endonuclease YhcR with UshA esterase domain